MERVRAGGRRDELDDDHDDDDDDRDNHDDHDDDHDDRRRDDDDHVKRGVGTMSPGRIFDIVAVICFAISCVPWPQPPVNLTGLGLVFFTLGHLFP